MIKKLLVHIGPYKRHVALVPLFMALDVACELSMPLLMSRIIDVGIANGDIAYIARIGLCMVALATVAMILGVMVMRLASVAAMGFGANLRAALFAKVQQFSFNNIDQFSTASLITRLTNDVNNIQLTSVMILRMSLRAPMMLLISFFVAYGISPRLSTVLGVSLLVLVVSVTFVIRAATRRFARVQKSVDALNMALQENLIAQRVIKAFVRADHEAMKFQGANDNLTNAFIAAVSVIILNQPIMMLIMNLSRLTVFWRGGQMVFAGEMGAGQLVSFTSYMFTILMSVMMTSFIFVMAGRAQASAERVLEVLDTPIDITDKPEVKETPPTARPTVTAGKVEFRNVAFKYSVTGTGQEVLSDINLVAEPGEVVAIVGGTGSGKTTLVNLIPRLYDVTAGAVLVDDVDVRDYTLETLREGIGVVLQDNTLFSGRIRDNLLWGREDASQEEVEAVCRDAQAHDFIMSFPDGYDTDLGQAAVNLSGGQKQRLCIARAMLKRPKILILDDSTSAVDSATEARIRQAFERAGDGTSGGLAGTTVFIIAQRISSVRYADKIVVLDDGKLVGVGTHEDLMAGNAVYQEIYQSQQKGVLAE